MIRFPIRLILALTLIAAPAAAIDYTQPPGAPQILVPNYGVTVSVFAAQTAIGHGIGIFERKPDGSWSLCGQCIISPEYPTLDNAVARVGGPGPYIESKRAGIDAVLASRYPAIGGGAPGTTLDQVNAALVSG